MYRLSCCLIGVTFLFVPGCGPKLPYEVVPFAGTVTYQGTPVPGLPIFFLPEEGRPSNGFSDKNGKFNMVYTVKVDGIQTGNGSFYIELSPGDGSLYDNRALLETIANKYPKRNELLQFEITKRERNFELKLE